MIFDLSVPKVLVLAVIALVVFGPDRLPALAAQAGRALRELRRMADGAKSELRENLGPEFSQLSQLDLAELNPRHFVRKHIVDEITRDGPVRVGGADDASEVTSDLSYGPTARLVPGERPPYDHEAT